MELRGNFHRQNPSFTHQFCLLVHLNVKTEVEIAIWTMLHLHQQLVCTDYTEMYAIQKEWSKLTPYSLRIYNTRKYLQQAIRYKSGSIHYLDLVYNTDKTYKCQTKFLNLHSRVLFFWKQVKCYVYLYTHTRIHTHAEDKQKTLNVY